MGNEIMVVNVCPGGCAVWGRVYAGMRACETLYSS